jgi:hypothetical protein
MISVSRMRCSRGDAALSHGLAADTHSANGGRPVAFDRLSIDHHADVAI